MHAPKDLHFFECAMALVNDKLYYENHKMFKIENHETKFTQTQCR